MHSSTADLICGSFSAIVSELYQVKQHKTLYISLSLFVLIVIINNQGEKTKMAVEQRQQDECVKKFMVAIDESESSHYALIWVLQNLRESIAQPGNKLYVFMAVPRAKNNSIFSASLGSARMYCNVSPTASFVNAVQETNNLVSLGILEKAKAICTSHGLNAETVTVVGDAREAICEAVEKCNINLLVLGDHGTSKIRRALLGSVSNYCVQNAKCPVLVVKKPE